MVGMVRLTTEVEFKRKKGAKMMLDVAFRRGLEFRGFGGLRGGVPPVQS